MRSKAFANVRSLGREGGRGEGGASPPNGPGAADIRGGASLTASDALSASLLFRWVARLPKVRCEKSAERESAEGRERERERERELERERKRRERAWRRKGGGAPFFLSLFTHHLQPTTISAPCDDRHRTGPALGPPGRSLHVEEEEEEQQQQQESEVDPPSPPPRSRERKDVFFFSSRRRPAFALPGLARAPLPRDHRRRRCHQKGPL